MPVCTGGLGKRFCCTSFVFISSMSALSTLKAALRSSIAALSWAGKLLSVLRELQGVRHRTMLQVRGKQCDDLWQQCWCLSGWAGQFCVWGRGCPEVELDEGKYLSNMSSFFLASSCLTLSSNNPFLNLRSLTVVSRTTFAA